MNRLIPSAIAELGIDEIYTIDAEFRPSDPNGYSKHGLGVDVIPDAFDPVCISAKRWTTRETSSLWYEPNAPRPWTFGADTLVVCFHAAAEVSFFIRAGWEAPTNILDLYPEYRLQVNGEFDAFGKRVGVGDHKESDGRSKYGLLSAASHYGLGSRSGVEKRSVIRRILLGSPYSEDERQAILAYNRDDVEDTEALFTSMIDNGHIRNVGQALMRGDAARGFALRELNGLPVNGNLVTRLKEHWNSIRGGAARAVEDRRGYGVFHLDVDGIVHFDYEMISLL